MSPTRRIGALALAVMVAVGLTACGPRAEDQQRTLENAIVETAPHTTAAAVFVSSAIGGDQIVVNLYVDSDDTADAAEAVEAALETVWTTTASEPVGVSIAVAAVPKPDEPQRLELNAIDPLPVAETLEIQGSKVVRQLLMLDSATLSNHFGAWHEPR